MIITSCPLRISLVGGSTDQEAFLKKYGHGAVISFPCNLRTYITLHQDTFGATALDHKYIINYSKREDAPTINDIKNELIRHCFTELNVEHVHCTLTSDVYSEGSGLAASSAYLQALIKGIYVLRNKKISEFEVCKLAQKIEKRFNPLVGEQDFYGSMGGLKRIDFWENSDPQIKYLKTELFNSMKMFLIHTGITRSSTTVLQSLNVDKTKELLKGVDALEKTIANNDNKTFNEIIKEGWKKKKETSPYICGHDKLKEMDELLSSDKNVFSHKLCGAGNGGYFLIFCNDKPIKLPSDNMREISIAETGLKYLDIRNEFARI